MERKEILQMIRVVLRNKGLKERLPRSITNEEAKEILQRLMDGEPPQSVLEDYRRVAVKVLLPVWLRRRLPSNYAELSKMVVEGLSKVITQAP